MVDPLGHPTVSELDAVYRLTRTVDAEGRATRLAYDPAGNLIRRIDPASNTTTYAYDDANRLTRRTTASGSTDFTLDDVGNITAIIHRNGRTRTFTYDPLNRVIREEWAAAPGEPPVSYAKTLTYDDAGQLTAASDNFSAYAYAYDNNGNVTQVTLSAAGGPLVNFAYAYDVADRLTTVTEFIGGQRGATTAYTHDRRGLVRTIEQSGPGVTGSKVTVTIDSAGQLTGVAREASSGVVAVTTIQYDNAGRLSSAEHTDGSGARLAAYFYTFDAADRLTALASSDGTAAYSYDDTNQLITADYSDQADESYSYDANGNRTGAGYQTGDQNRLAAAPGRTYEYDAEGNRTLVTDAVTGQKTRYRWDHGNRLVGVTVEDAGGRLLSSAAYTYDVNDRRVAKRVDPDGTGPNPAVVERYVWERDNIALTFNAANARTHRYVYGPVTDMVLVDEDAVGTLRWPLGDHQQTVRDVAVSSGMVVNHLTFDSFGNLTGQTNSAEQPRFVYAGRELDPETGLYQVRARYYDPAAGRFLSEDPIGYQAGDPNLYRYVGNQVTTGTDPSGNQGEFDPFQYAADRAADLQRAAGVTYGTVKTAGKGLVQLVALPVATATTFFAGRLALLTGDPNYQEFEDATRPYSLQGVVDSVGAGFEFAGKLVGPCGGPVLENLANRTWSSIVAAANEYDRLETEGKYFEAGEKIGNVGGEVFNVLAGFAKGITPVRGFTLGREGELLTSAGRRFEAIASAEGSATRAALGSSNEVRAQRAVASFERSAGKVAPEYRSLADIDAGRAPRALRSVEEEAVYQAALEEARGQAINVPRPLIPGTDKTDYEALARLINEAREKQVARILERGPLPTRAEIEAYNAAFEEAGFHRLLETQDRLEARELAARNARKNRAQTPAGKLAEENAKTLNFEQDNAQTRRFAPDGAAAADDLSGPATLRRESPSGSGSLVLGEGNSAASGSRTALSSAADGPLPFDGEVPGFSRTVTGEFPAALNPGRTGEFGGEVPGLRGNVTGEFPAAPRRRDLVINLQQGDPTIRQAAEALAAQLGAELRTLEEIRAYGFGSLREVNTVVFAGHGGFRLRPGIDADTAAALVQQFAQQGGDVSRFVDVTIGGKTAPYLTNLLQAVSCSRIELIGCNVGIGTLPESLAYAKNVPVTAFGLPIQAVAPAAPYLPTLYRNLPAAEQLELLYRIAVERNTIVAAPRGDVLPYQPYGGFEYNGPGVAPTLTDTPTPGFVNAYTALPGVARPQDLALPKTVYYGSQTLPPGVPGYSSAGRNLQPTNYPNLPTGFSNQQVGAVVSAATSPGLIDREHAADLLQATRPTWARGVAGADRLAVQVALEDLEGAAVAEARVTQVGADGLPTAGVIVLDPSAAGVGWFVDPTPLDAAEFARALGAFALQATADSLAAGRYDLSTVLLHEMGHLLGFLAGVPGFDHFTVGTLSGSRVFLTPDVVAQLTPDGSHLDPRLHPDDLLNPVLRPGVRRLVTPLDVAILQAVRAQADLSPPAGPVPPLHIPALLAEQEGAPAVVVNGLFDVASTSDPAFGWNSRGAVAVVGGAAVLREDVRYNSRLSQTFVVPQGTTALQFTLTDVSFLSNAGPRPPDAFEVALLDADTGLSLVATAAGLTETDALLNVQATGEVYFGSEVAFAGRGISGQRLGFNGPVTFTIDLTGVAAGTEATLYFDLLGFGARASSVTVDDVVFVGAVPPPLSVALDATADTGVVGDQVTSEGTVSLACRTAPGGEVLLDTDGDGFDDGRVTADATGTFSFTDLGVPEGVTTFRVQAANDAGTTAVSRTVTCDARGPVGLLAGPLPGTRTDVDLGYVAVQWADVGLAGVDETTFDPSDVRLSGVNVDRVENLGGGVVLYHYADDGERLTTRTVTVELVAGAVGDRAGNPNAGVSAFFFYGGVSNNAPVTSARAYEVPQGGVLAVGVATGLLAEARDADGDPLFVRLETGPADGLLTLNADGSFAYLPDPDFAGTDTFTYRASDGENDSAPTVVTLTVRARSTSPGEGSPKTETPPAGEGAGELPSGSQTPPGGMTAGTPGSQLPAGVGDTSAIPSPGAGTPDVSPPSSAVPPAQPSTQPGGISIPATLPVAGAGAITSTASPGTSPSVGSKAAGLGVASILTAVLGDDPAVTVITNSLPPTTRMPTADRPAAGGEVFVSAVTDGATAATPSLVGEEEYSDRFWPWLQEYEPRRPITSVAAASGDDPGVEVPGVKSLALPWAEPWEAGRWGAFPAVTPAALDRVFGAMSEHAGEDADEWESVPWEEDCGADGTLLATVVASGYAAAAVRAPLPDERRDRRRLPPTDTLRGRER